ncbi:MAG: DNA starvation/stationary phase protection protein Dps [Phycisphaeraceae bacterium]|nr:DNA starvation/stationary phase protection protein Dps [Phycisphaeraceae bacterium]
MSHDVPTRSCLSPATRVSTCAVLEARLRDTLDLHGQFRAAHWNVRGPRFAPLHGLFEEIAGSLLAHADDLAERAGALGRIVHATVRAAAAGSGLPEPPADLTAEDAWLDHLAGALAALSRSLHADIAAADAARDPVTADLLTQMAADIDKRLWFIESHRAR